MLRAVPQSRARCREDIRLVYFWKVAQVLHERLLSILRFSVVFCALNYIHRPILFTVLYYFTFLFSQVFCAGRLLDCYVTRLVIPQFLGSSSCFPAKTIFIQR